MHEFKEAEIPYSRAEKQIFSTPNESRIQYGVQIGTKAFKNLRKRCNVWSWYYCTQDLMRFAVLSFLYKYCNFGVSCYGYRIRFNISTK